MTTLTSPTDWKDVLSKRTARRRANVLRLHPSVDQAAALVDAPVGQTSIDEVRRCATFVISTPTPDRSEDVVVPRGVNLGNYARNPVVYYDHGFSGIQVPIGKCEDESGQLAVVVTDAGIEGTCYFADSVEGQQIFELVKQSVLRAASINLVPIAYTVRADDGLLGRPGMEIEEWELLEWSVVGIPDNPEAIRKILAGGKLAGSPICEPIRESLLTACSKPQPRLLGKECRAALEPRPNSVRKDDADGADRAESVSCGTDSMIFGGLGEPFEEEEDGQTITPDKPSGAKTLEKCHSLLEAVCNELEVDATPLEHPAVKAFCKELHAGLTGHLDEIRKCYKAHYAELGDLGLNAFDAQEHGSKSALRLLDCCSELRAVRRARGLDPKLARRLASVETRINDCYGQARKRKPTSEVTLSADTAVVLDLLQEFNGLVNELGQSVPRPEARRTM